MNSPKPAADDRTAVDLRRQLLRGLAAVDRRLRLRRALAALVWLAPAASLWLLSTWLLRLSAGDDGLVAALWPSWAGGVVLVALLLREAAALRRDLPAAARAVDRSGDLHDAVATALEMQRRLPAARGDRADGHVRADMGWPLPWISLVLERAVHGLRRTGPRQVVPRLAPRGAAIAAATSLVLLLPVALPTSIVGEALAAAVSGDGDSGTASGLETAGLLEQEPGRRPGVPELDVRLSDLPFLTLRVREPGPEDGATADGGDGSDALAGGLGDETNPDSVDGTAETGESGDLMADAAGETGADLMRELDTGEAAGNEEGIGTPGMPGEGEAMETGEETAAGEGAGGQPTEDSAGEGNESGTAAAISEQPGSSTGEADGAAAGVGTGPQEEMVDPFGDLLTPNLSLQQALETALLESLQDVERQALSTTSATQFRAAEVAMRRPAGRAAGSAAAAAGELPPPRHPIAWRHRVSVRRYLESLEEEPE